MLEHGGYGATLKGTYIQLHILSLDQKSFGSTNEIGIFEMQSGGLVSFSIRVKCFWKNAWMGDWFDHLL